MAKAGTIRGLQVFISDIRACQNREAEARRVDKELAKIRAKFGDEKKALSAYDRKKYVWKLLYIYMLGYDVEFGHKQACDLIPASK
jgi:AP-2 complex subunit alpha